MDLERLPQLVRNAGRLHEVVAVLVRYGLAPWLKNARVDWIQKHLRTGDGQQISELSQAERIRLALTDLGTTFIKLGQVLSTRVDLVGPDIAEELAKLQSGTPPDSHEAVAELIASELGKSPDELFASFEGKALASASIGQVHAAELVDGTPVVVKVQHTGIEDRVRNDLEILVELARLAEAHAPKLKPYRPLATAAEFKKTLENELDFTLEQRNLLRFARKFEEDPGIRFPAPYVDLCSRRVLTMDRLEGISLSKRAELVEAGFDLSDLARRGADMFLRMVFRDGFYHADPHPGNLMVLEGEVIGVIDCGMVGRVDDDLREQFEDLLVAAVERDTEGLLDSVVRMGRVPADLDRGVLKSELLDLVDDYGSQSMDNFDLSGALNEMTRIIRRHYIRLPARVSLLLKMLVMLEGTAQQLTPDFSLAELLQPYRADAIRRRLSPTRLWHKLQLAHRDWSRLAESFPGDVSDIMDRVRRGRFDVHLEHRRLDTIVNRLVLGVLTAALFIGSASLWSNGVGPVVVGLPLPGAIGCAAAIYLGVGLIRAIRKSGNIQAVIRQSDDAD